MIESLGLLAEGRLSIVLYRQKRRTAWNNNIILA